MKNGENGSWSHRRRQSSTNNNDSNDGKTNLNNNEHNEKYSTSIPSPTVIDRLSSSLSSSSSSSSSFLLLDNSAHNDSTMSKKPSLQGLKDKIINYCQQSASSLQAQTNDDKENDELMKDFLNLLEAFMLELSKTRTTTNHDCTNDNGQDYIATSDVLWFTKELEWRFHDICQTTKQGHESKKQFCHDIVQDINALIRESKNRHEERNKTKNKNYGNNHDQHDVQENDDNSNAKNNIHASFNNLNKDTSTQRSRTPSKAKHSQQQQHQQQQQQSLQQQLNQLQLQSEEMRKHIVILAKALEESEYQRAKLLENATTKYS